MRAANPLVGRNLTRTVTTDECVVPDHRQRRHRRVSGGDDKHDEHVLRAFSEMTMACVFNPPLSGKEVHNAEGAYELDAEEIDA